MLLVSLALDAVSHLFGDPSRQLPLPWLSINRPFLHEPPLSNCHPAVRPDTPKSLKNSLQKEYQVEGDESGARRVAVMESWSTGVMDKFLNTTGLSFHYSNTPILQTASSAGYEHYGMLEAIKVK